MKAHSFACFAFLLLPGVAGAIDVRMAFGEKIPPFCFPETNSGIELEVIGEALAYKGHVLKPVYVPFARIPLSFKDKTVDAVMTDLGQDLGSVGGHYGAPAVIYDNVFITLQSRQLHLKRPANLQGLSVVSFRGAAARYPNWLSELQGSRHYTELNDQEAQVKTLMKGRYDVVLSDRNIFKYFALKLKKDGFEVAPVQEHPFTTVNPQDYRPIFRDPKVRDDFNLGLKQLKDSGRFQAIYDKYLKE
ncbi:substrate-binding periplasmic protein [Roseateles oligotrophus]|uniref:ABC transporter substrate-binding protein n=1 Tax=Roseateles oligotrophus TaxID=1769250 RepID=A0ABT2YC66_9BURK|nr:ABC transporter substrate-binding protein [Roseateles oligotrophus]MCV2367630.1 ABC transporter substrate-binding protein [Roseateles oligotrophus]